jgi:hypothetical protein
MHTYRYRDTQKSASHVIRQYMHIHNSVKTYIHICICMHTYRYRDAQKSASHVISDEMGGADNVFSDIKPEDSDEVCMYVHIYVRYVYV